MPRSISAASLCLVGGGFPSISRSLSCPRYTMRAGRDGIWLYQLCCWEQAPYSNPVMQGIRQHIAIHVRKPFMLSCVSIKDMIVSGIMKYFRNVLGHFSSLYQSHCLHAFSNKSRRLTDLKSSFIGQGESSKIMSSSCI